MPTKQHAVRQGLPRVIVGIAALGLTFSMAVFATGHAVEADASIAATRQIELVKLVRQDCGSCHGLALKGGLGPALSPEALKDKPADSLKSVILHGRPHTAMPPWQRFLSEADVEWIVSNLQKGFPR